MTSNLRSLFDRSPEFQAVIDDGNVKHVMIQPSGRFEYVKLGRHRLGTAEVDMSVLTELRQRDRFEEWAVRTFEGAWGVGILLERLPTPVVDRLPQPVVNNLKRIIRKDGVGAIVGGPGASKSTLLLWLAMQWAEETIIFVSENPPADMVSGHVVHVYPPNTPAARRDLERLIRLSNAVFWDRVTFEDLATLLTFPSGKRRWFTVDGSANDVPVLLNAMDARGLRPRLDAVMLVSTSVIGRAEVQNLVLRESGEWDEVYALDGSIVSMLGRPPLAVSQSLPAIPASDAVSTLAEASSEPDPPLVGLQESSSMAGIRKRPGQPTADFDNPLTIPVSEEGESLFQESDTAEPDQATGLLSGGDLALFAPKRSAIDSGEIDVPAFRTNLPEVTRQYAEVADKGETATADGDLLARLLPSIQRDQSTAPNQVNLEDLRITRVEDVDENVLENTRAIRDAYLKVRGEEELPNISFDEESDAEENEIAGVMSEHELEEISGMLLEDDIATSVASAAEYALQGWKSKNDGPPEYMSDPDTNPTMSAALPPPSVENHDATEEVNLGDKLRLMRARFQRKDDD
ncbi:MAG: hypothetical protein R3E66_13780 [bacterium]